MKRLGAGGYRFSISWPRIQPTGSRAGQRSRAWTSTTGSSTAARGGHPADGHALPLGPAAGARGRRRLAEPRHGRPRSPSTPRSSASASPTGSSTGSRSTSPTSCTMLGYGDRRCTRPGKHADVRRAAGGPPPAARPTAARRSRCAPPGATSVGCANNHAPMWPASDDAADVGATKLFDALWNGLFVEPMLLGRYPVDLAPLLEDVVAATATWRRSASRSTSTASTTTTRCRSRPPPRTPPMPFELRELLGYPTTDFGWPVVPDALREWLIMFRARYRAALPPIMITETGCSYDDGPGRSTASSTTSAASTTSTPTCARSPTAIRARRRRPRLLRLVADGQLRVGRGLHPALRPGARRLRDPGAHAEAAPSTGTPT